MSTDLKTQEQKPLTPSERFAQKVVQQFAADNGAIELTNFQNKLVRNYFIKLDAVLKAAELKRLKAAENRREPLAYIWENINMNKLAVDVVAYAMVGMDPLQPNHINLIPYKNSATNKYDITFMMGYRGLELKAVKYGLDVPTDVIIEVVYSNDKFRPFKKDRNNETEGYEFEIVNPFDRGQIIGGFIFFNYVDEPFKNKLRIMSMADIEKRKPEYASTEFWGGEKDVWKNNAKTGEKEQVDGWLDEMVYKTLYRAAYNSITIDSEKIDDNFVKVMELEREAAGIPKTVDEKVALEIQEKAGTEDVGFTVIDEQQPAAEAPVAEKVLAEKKTGAKKSETKEEDKPPF